MSENHITILFSNNGSRNEVRMRVVEQFASEVCGKGSGELASRYTYYVETLINGDRIYLRRPANLHNGFDFLVCIENINFSTLGQRYRNYPKHEDIISDLSLKKKFEPNLYKELFELMKQVYNCNDLIINDYQKLNFKTGFTTELILKTLKWLFIEQDIRYWNYSGRDMLWNGIMHI
ncbi:DNA adenine methylase [Sedimentibacter saalensis]|uniref:DNA adenine methylase n=1 Tax=Sedimentibacter saalensis TaxID=130788 RepID=A0A562JK37_9FIRM|nr:DNA adenine methylase [Sedimentibacter saalensis]TWH83632.1 hypothetical protein LY60_00243 [Sedimentibacter saalensis]